MKTRKKHVKQEKNNNRKKTKKQFETKCFQNKKAKIFCLFIFILITFIYFLFIFIYFYLFKPSPLIEKEAYRLYNPHPVFLHEDYLQKNKQ